MQTISMFETDSREKPLSQLSSTHQTSLQMFVDELARKEWAEEFVEEVPSSIPSLHSYDSLVPVRMELRLIQQRLSSSFYRSCAQIVWDLRLIASNCLLFNDPQSLLAQHARILDETVKLVRCEECSIPQIPEYEPKLEMNEPVNEVVTRMNQLWGRCQELVRKEIPPYLIEYAAQL